MDELRGKLVIKGERGYSAYEIAVKNGYEGTEQDWIDHFGLDLTDYVKTTDILNLVYPVGAIYISVSNTNPSSIFGGTWEQIKDKFLLSAGDTYTAGNTGGEATHTLTKAELPTINGKINFHGASSSTPVSSVQGDFTTDVNNTKYKNGGTETSGAGSVGNVILNIGSDSPHNNMPPYLVVYVWKRTA